MPTRHWTLTRQLEFLAYSTYAEARAEGQRTYLGLVWWLVEPAISLVVYYIVFEMVLDRGGPNFVFFLFVGLVPWRWLSASVQQGGTALLNSRSLMQLVYVPKAVFPMRLLASNTLKFIPVFGLVIGVVIAAGTPPSWAYLALPIVVVSQLVLLCGCVLFLGAVVPLFPDLRLIIGSLLRLWLFLSGVFFDIKTLDGQIEQAFRLNPMTGVLESYRDILLQSTFPTTTSLWPAVAAGALLSALGVGLLRHFDTQFPKMV